MVGGDWCFRLRGLARAAGAVLVLAIPCDWFWIGGGDAADGARCDGSVCSSGGPDVNQIG